MSFYLVNFANVYEQQNVE